MTERTHALVMADLFFASKVRAVAQNLGATIALARNAAHVLELTAALKPRVVLLDLEFRGADPATLIRQLKSSPQSAAIPIVGFASHMNAHAIAAAREAGADRVLARSAFTRILPELIENGLGAIGADPDEK